MKEGAGAHGLEVLKAEPLDWQPKHHLGLFYRNAKPDPSRSLQNGKAGAGPSRELRKEASDDYDAC